MRRNLAIIAAVIAAFSLLTGCSANRDYCNAVESAEAKLQNFGKRSNAAFASYAKVTGKIADAAPKDIADDWRAISKATKAVVEAHEDAGVDLSEMRKVEKVSQLNPGQVEELNAVYEKFNETKTERSAVVADVAKRCKIDLAQRKEK